MILQLRDGAAAGGGIRQASGSCSRAFNQDFLSHILSSQKEILKIWSQRQLTTSVPKMTSCVPEAMDDPGGDVNEDLMLKAAVEVFATNGDIYLFQ